MTSTRCPMITMWNVDRISLFFIRKLFHLLGVVPDGRAIRLARFFGRLWFALDRRHRRIALENLTRALGDEKSPGEIQVLARTNFAETCRIPFELGRSLKLPLSEFGRSVRIEGLENYLSAAEKGRGVLVLTGHLGNWELLAVIAGLTGLRVNVLYRPLDFEPMDRFINQARTRFGDRMIPKRGALLRVFKALRRGEAVVMLMDQNVGRSKGVFVDFFGQSTCTNKAMAFIALKTGAPVVPVFVLRDGDGFTAEFGPEIPLLRTGDFRKDVEENTQQYSHAMESFIRKYPEQWFWVHRRWKTLPYCPWPRD